jgi:hypothetical protein
MTTIKQEIKRKNLQQEVQQIRRAGQKIGTSKQCARDFLISTGIYSATGQLKPAFR